MISERNLRNLPNAIFEITRLEIQKNFWLSLPRNKVKLWWSDSEETIQSENCFPQCFSTVEKIQLVGKIIYEVRKNYQKKKKNEGNYISKLL